MSGGLAIFDLDGTLSDSAPGIVGSLRLAFAEHGLAPLTAEQEIALVGPPFHTGLLPYVDEDRVWDVIDTYRRHYRGGLMYETSVYAGIPELLYAARDAGLRLAVATSKPEPQAVLVVERLGLAAFFDTIGGDELDASRGSKALVIAEVLRRLGTPDPEDVVMIGDRAQDVEGARAHGIRCIGAGWGYGAPGELAAAGASPVCPSPVALLPQLVMLAAQATGLDPAGPPEAGRGAAAT